MRMAPLVLLVLVGCDPALRREGGAAEAPAPAGSPRLGREGESCARVADCLRAGLAPLAAEFAKGGSSGSWQGTVTVTVRPSRQERP